MKKIKLRGTFAAMMVIGLLAFTASCSQEETARVTVHFGQGLQAYHADREGILDRIAGVLFTRAYAITAPPEWTGDYDSLMLTVTGADLDPIAVNVPPGASSYTLEIPSGEARLFTAVAYSGAVKKWGGHGLSNLKAGEQSVSLNLFPVPTGLTNTAIGYAYLDWDRVIGAAGHYVYRAANPSGPFARIDTLIGDATGWMEPDFLLNGTYYYRISVFYPSGEGEPTDAIAVVVFPL